MFGLEFLFSAALFALPLAGVPVLLHLLLKQRTPTVQFSTLRFVKSSLQRTAARRKVKRWLLLALRVLLLLLLIWAVAQPAKKLAGDWFGGSASGVAAIVVDASYSMQLRPESTDGGGTLLDRADVAVREMLRGPLNGAQVAIFTSNPSPPDRSEILKPAASWLTGWAPLRPEAAPVPLVDRLGAALEFLRRQSGSIQWLIVVTDDQRREFPRALADVPEGVRVVWLDLHPDEARDAGITRVWLDPDQPIPGVGSEAAVEVTGRAGETRAVSLELRKPDGTALASFGPAVATFDGRGRSVVRFPIQLPAEPWLVLHAALGGQDAIDWNNARDDLIRVPRRQRVKVVTDEKQPAGVGGAGAARFLTLALDPNEGTLAGWPLEVKSGRLTGDEDAIFTTWTKWPDLATATELEMTARRGGRVVILLDPSLGSAWAKLSNDVRAALTRLLPAQPSAEEASGRWRLVAPAPDEPLTAGLDATRLRVGDAVVKRFVAFGPTDAESRTVIEVAPSSAGPNDGTSRTLTDARRRGLLFRKPLGAGEVYTLATLPDPRLTNLPTHPLFLPLVVRMALPAPAGVGGVRGTTTNAELGTRLVLMGTNLSSNPDGMELVSPSGQVTRVSKSSGTGAAHFVFEGAGERGIYKWQVAGLADAMAFTNVTYPAAEADADYRPADQIVKTGSNVMVARSYAELTSHLTSISEPQPRWPAFVAAVLMLVCVESMVGSVAQWKRQGRHAG